MRQRSQGFRFRGFVALADMLFALSSGLLLLNPIRLKPTKPPTPVPVPAVPPATPIVDHSSKPVPVAKPLPAPMRPQAIDLEVRKVEERLDKLETDGRQIQAQAVELLKTE